MSWNLPRETVHLWYTLVEDWSDLPGLEPYRAWMSEDEAQRQGRFFFERDRHAFLVTRAFHRGLLSRYAPIAPAAWSFVTNGYGRPEILEPAGWRSLRFNLSHSKGIIACGFVWDVDLGVDVEDTHRMTVGPDIARHYFAPAEVTQLEARPDAEQQQAFFHYWTLKEAYIKGRGMGLSLPLDRFSFDVWPGRPVSISIDPSLKDHAPDWQFHQFRPTERYQGAVGIRRASSPDFPVLVRRIGPEDLE